MVCIWGYFGSAWSHPRNKYGELVTIPLMPLLPSIHLLPAVVHLPWVCFLEYDGMVLVSLKIYCTHWKKKLKNLRNHGGRFLVSFIRGHFPGCCWSMQLKILRFYSWRLELLVSRQWNRTQCCGTFWLHSNTPETANKVYFESEGGASYSWPKLAIEVLEDWSYIKRHRK